MEGSVSGSGSGSAGAICPDDEDARMAEEDSPEESSWTFYIEGLMRDDNDNDNDDINSLSSASEMAESPSLVSDAASSAVVKKLSSSYYNCCVCRSNTDDDDDDGGACRLGFTSAAAKGSIRNMLIKQNSFKKQKNKVFLPSVMDYDLEDTASSPVNSPKVSYMNQFMNEKDKAKIDVSDQVKRKSIGKGGIFAVERKSNYTDLQKRTYD